MNYSRAVFALVPALLIVAPAVATGASAPVGSMMKACGEGYYQDSRGHCVPRPQRARQAPDGASARCRDGTYSFSHSRRGTCSRHGGVAVWL